MTGGSVRPDDPTSGAAGHAIVDSHVHIWDARRADYPWLSSTAQLADAYSLSDVAADHATYGVRQIVLVQAADNFDDSEHMLAASREHPAVAGVVVWLPLRQPALAETMLDRWAGLPVVGARHMVHRDPDPNLLLDPSIDDTLGLLADRGMTFDVCAESLHLLGLVPGLAARHPRLRIIVDHLAKPPIAVGGWEPWATRLHEAAQAPNVATKLSGLNTAAAPRSGAMDLRRYVDHALAAFGADRVMFGSDWPFALLAAESYSQIVDPLFECVAALAPAAVDEILGGTARRIYRLPPI